MMTGRRRLASAALLAAAVMLIFAALLLERPREYSGEEFLMDTLVSIRVYGSDVEKLKKATELAFVEMRRIEDISDRFAEPGTAAYSASDVCRINEKAGQEPVAVSSDVFRMLELSQEYFRLTKGAFDVTIGPVADSWGFGRSQQGVPEKEQLEKARKLADNGALVLNASAQTVFLAKAGMKLDLGGVAKGYATERALEVLQEKGIEAALIDAGGNIRVLGSKDGKTPWKIGVRDPRDPSGLLATLDLTGGSCVTSGDYNRYFEADGTRYHHILSPYTGYPARENISVTVLTEDAAAADILSTALFVLKPQEALVLAEELEDTEAMLVTAQRDILMTSGLKNKAELLAGEGYSYDKSR